MIDGNIFTFLTPVIYWLLAIFWSLISIFYIRRIRNRNNNKDNFLKVLLIILLLDALRTLIESSYFGVWYTSLSGLIDIEFYNALARPEIVFFPKIINLAVSVLIIIIIIKRWVPEENQRIIEYKRLIHDQKLILEQIPLSIVITDLNGDIEYVNSKFYSITGYSKEEIIGSNPRILNSGKSDITNYSKLWATITSGKEWNGLFHNKKRNGDLYWENATIKPLIDSEGKIRNYLAIKEDITEKLEIDNKNQMLLTTIEQISDTIELLDLEGKIQYVNRTFLNKTGYTKEECLGKYPVDLFSDEHNINKEMNEIFAKAMKEHRHCKGRFINKTKNGNFLTEEVSITPIFDKFGNLTNYSAIKRDITEFIKTEQEQKSIREQLDKAQKLESVGQLVGGIAHDFNNSLGGIMAAAQLLSNPKRLLDEKSLTYVDMILKSSKLAAGLTNKLMTFSKKKNNNFTIIHLYEIVKDTADILKQTINKTITIELINNFKNDIISGDISSLQSVLINFGINASHAISGVGFIRFKMSNIILDKKYCEQSTFNITPGYYCLIEVEDTGTGIKQENIKKIFDPFFTTKNQGVGTGLGLASSQRVIIEHKGAIEVKSIIKEGSSFKVLIPGTDNSETCNTELKTVKGKGNILLVDDEETNRILGKDILNSLGYNVLLAKDGVETLKIYIEKRDEIDLILLDMIMPGMSGEDLFFNLKKINKNCKIIILSGYISDIDIINLTEKGLNGIIKKPYRIADLSQKISRVLL